MLPIAMLPRLTASLCLLASSAPASAQPTSFGPQINRRAPIAEVQVEARRAPEPFGLVWPRRGPDDLHAPPIARRPHAIAYRRTVDAAESRSPRHAPAPSLPDIDLTVLLTSDLGGQLATFECGDVASRKGDITDLTATLVAERKRARDLELPEPISVSAGDLLGQGPLTRYLLATQQMERLAEILSPLRFDLAVLGDKELGLPRDAFLSWVRQAGRSVNYAAANAACRSPLSPACAVINRGETAKKGYVLVTRGGIKVALIPLTVPGRQTQASPWSSELSLRDPVAVARSAAQRARREDRAHVVAVVAHVGESAAGLGPVLRLARRVKEADLILTNGLASSAGLYGIQEIRFTQSEQPPVIAAPPSPYQPMRITVHLAYLEGAFRPTRLTAQPVSTAPAAPEVRAAMTETLKEYCDAWGTPLISGALEGEDDPEDLVTFALNVLRFETQREIAALLRREIDVPSFARWPRVITRDRLVRALPFDHGLQAYSLRGDALIKWLDKVYPGAEALHPDGVRFSGIEFDEGEYRVNSRILDPTEHYDLVVSAALAGQLLPGAPPPPADVEGEPLAEPRNTRQAIVNWLAERRFLGVKGPAGENGDLTFPSLEESILWRKALDLSVGFDQTTVSNGSRYHTQPQLTRDEFVGLEAGTKARIDALSLHHEWNNLLDLTYATNRSGSNASYSESKDLTLMETTYSWLTVRNEWAGGNAGVPVPMTRLRLETELSKEEESPFHHMELTEVLGIRWIFTDTMSLSLGYGLGTEMLAPEPELSHGPDLTFEVLKTPLFDIRGAPIFLETRFDFFYRDPTERDAVEALLSSELAYTLTPVLALTIGADAFAYSAQDGPFAFSTDIMFGLKASMASHSQSF